MLKIKRITRKFGICFRFVAQPSQPLTFPRVGVDYARPFMTKNIAIFADLVTKAVQIKVVSGLSLATVPTILVSETD